MPIYLLNLVIKPQRYNNSLWIYFLAHPLVFASVSFSHKIMGLSINCRSMFKLLTRSKLILIFAAHCGWKCDITAWSHTVKYYIRELGDHYPCAVATKIPSYKHGFHVGCREWTLYKYFYVLFPVCVSAYVGGSLMIGSTNSFRLPPSFSLYRNSCGILNR